jgi:hypothetical protein
MFLKASIATKFECVITTLLELFTKPSINATAGLMPPLDAAKDTAGRLAVPGAPASGAGLRRTTGTATGSAATPIRIAALQLLVVLEARTARRVDVTAKLIKRSRLAMETIQPTKLNTH